MLHNSTPPLPILYLSSRKHLHQRCEVRSCINMAQTGNLSKHDFFFLKTQIIWILLEFLQNQLFLLIAPFYTLPLGKCLCVTTNWCWSWFELTAPSRGSECPHLLCLVTPAVQASPLICSPWWFGHRLIFFPLCLKKLQKLLHYVGAWRFYFKIVWDIFIAVVSASHRVYTPHVHP